MRLELTCYVCNGKAEFDLELLNVNRHTPLQELVHATGWGYQEYGGVWRVFCSFNCYKGGDNASSV